MYKNHWVTSDVQFRKGASIPLFGWGLARLNLCYDLVFNKKLHLSTFEHSHTHTHTYTHTHTHTNTLT